MKKILILLPALLLSVGLFGQFKIQSQQKNAFTQHKLGVLSDSSDPVVNSALSHLFSKYWKMGTPVILENESQVAELEKNGEYIFVRHAARLLKDDKGEFRTDFLDFYDSEWQNENLATCYMGTSSMASNHLYIKFFIRAIERSMDNNDVSDSLNLKRNGEELAQLKNNTLYIPRRLLAEGSIKTLESFAYAATESKQNALAQGSNAGFAGSSAAVKGIKKISLGAYTFRYKIVDDKQLNELANDDHHAIYVANLVTLPDHTTGIYIYDVNAGKVLYKSSQKESLFNLTAFEDINMAILKTRLQSSL